MSEVVRSRQIQVLHNHLLKEQRRRQKASRYKSNPSNQTNEKVLEILSVPNDVNAMSSEEEQKVSDRDDDSDVVYIGSKQRRIRARRIRRGQDLRSLGALNPQDFEDVMEHLLGEEEYDDIDPEEGNDDMIASGMVCAVEMRSWR